MNCHMPVARARLTAELEYPLSMSARYTMSSGTPLAAIWARIIASYRGRRASQMAIRSRPGPWK